ncbi:MAG TPA: helix-turn-helix transcriptional regulator [Sphingobacteriaceae bacterium]|nr:helix-turn-helix transcriptional regulator [Sphingobacteriaceae bacterium]
MKELGDRIKYLREKLNWTQPQLSEKTKLSTVQLSRYETNDRKPDPEALHKLADALDTNADYLLGRTDDPSPMPKKSSGGRAFLGGPNQYTEEELEIAELAAQAAIEAWRKSKANKNNKA